MMEKRGNDYCAFRHDLTTALYAMLHEALDPTNEDTHFLLFAGSSRVGDAGFEPATSAV
jgi:hypothetical protein